MGITTIGTLTLDELVASGKSPLHTRVVEIPANSGELKRGQLIGEKTSTTGEGGSAVTTTTYEKMASGFKPYGILCEDVTVGDNPVNVTVYVSGHFNGNKVIGYTEDYYNDLRDKGIYVEKALAY